ncbi:MAG TPA: zinc ribbon domain-containing protein [candidate division Zixibacteria bacterium]|nr:zinc ribbon domain-containing protein [candidate division Zixibacteria bacterium]
MEFYSEENKKERVFKWKHFFNLHKATISYLFAFLLFITSNIIMITLFMIIPEDISSFTLYYVGKLYVLEPIYDYYGHNILLTPLTYVLFGFCVIANIITGLFLFQKEYDKKITYFISIYWVQYLVLLILGSIKISHISSFTYTNQQHYIYIIGFSLFSLFLNFPIQLKMISSRKTFREWFTSREEKERFQNQSGYWLYTLFNRGFFLLTYLFTLFFMILAYTNAFDEYGSDIVFIIYVFSFLFSSAWIFVSTIGEKLVINQINYKLVKGYLIAKEFDLQIIASETNIPVEKIEKILMRKIKRNKLQGIVLNDIHRYLPTSIKEEVEEKEKTTIDNEIAIEKEQLEAAYKTLVKYLIEIKPNIQVTLDRLAELSKTTKNLTEMILNDLIKYYPEIGEYYTLEQVFIRKKDTEKILREILTNPLQKLRRYTCFYCGEIIDNNMAICPNCNEKVKRCSACKLPVSFKESIGECKKCNSQAHLIHIQEWVKANGKCPNCLRPLTLKQIKQTK